jgi:hypothetical protein
MLLKRRGRRPSKLAALAPWGDGQVKRSRDALRAPSPRARGEGRDEGAWTGARICGAQNCGEAPSPSLAPLARPLPARRGEVKAISFSRRDSRPSFANAVPDPSLRGAKRRSNPDSAAELFQRLKQPNRPTGLLRFARNDERKEKRKAERRQTCVQPPRLFRARRASSGTRSPVGVPPRLLSVGRYRPFGATPGQASWDAAGRSILYGRLNREAETLRS